MDNLESLREEFQPKSSVVTSLPDPKNVMDLTEVILRTGQSYKVYKMIDGVWVYAYTLTKE